MSQGSRDYYEQRARDEAAYYLDATTPAVAAAHRLLAIEYAAHARELGSDFHLDPELTNRRPILTLKIDA